jgi:hypothetical protein
VPGSERPGTRGATRDKPPALLRDSDILVHGAYAACAAIAIGSIGPWAQFGSTHSLGIDSDGQITIGLALAAAAILWSWSQFATREKLLGLCLISGGSAALTVYDASELSRVAQFSGASVGWGLIVTLLASLVVLGVAIRLLILNPA